MKNTYECQSFIRAGNCGKDGDYRRVIVQKKPYGEA